MEGENWVYEVRGIPDEFFQRSEGIPMTKREIRIISLSDLRIRPGMRVMDIGCGSGSMTVEISNIIGENGSVTGLDVSGEAADLTMRNCRNLCRFSNYRIVISDVYKYDSDEEFDAVFVGGGTARIHDLFERIERMVHHASRVVVNAIQIHTAYLSLEEMNTRGYSGVNITQVMVSNGMRTSEGYAMIARNPVFIISGDAP
ncbi:precorrin-6Y C5,15-methyltransferase (decarboxylating) subunit CbiT [Thermoplasma acidophilum]|nr:precorrin-6Y C5,15-methyltransferase (decarboxylating) subunit CbiT [Thermoplasma acidophilum]